MTVNELNKYQLNELRDTYFDHLVSTDASILKDIKISSDIPLSNVRQYYEGVYFVKDDFFSLF